jgi:hypothetical protein
MKFFTAILSALALAVSTTSATPIDSRGRTFFPLNIMKRLTSRDVYPGTPVAVSWNSSLFPVAGQTGNLLFGYINGSAQYLCKLFSLPPPPRAPVASNSFFQPWLNWENLICVRPPHLDKNPLMQGFPLSQGSIGATIPNYAPPGNTYIFCGKCLRAVSVQFLERSPCVKQSQTTMAVTGPRDFKSRGKTWQPGQDVCDEDWTVESQMAIRSGTALKVAVRDSAALKDK